MEYLIIRNNKAPVKCVFDYMKWEELKNPQTHQRAILSEICDGVEFFFSDKSHKAIAKDQMNPGDYLYLRPVAEELGKPVMIVY